MLLAHGPSPWHRPQSLSSLIMPLLNIKPNYSVSALSEKEKEKIDLEIKAKEDFCLFFDLMGPLMEPTRLSRHIVSNRIIE